MKKISILFTFFLLAAITNAQMRYFAGTLTGPQAGTASTGTGVVIVKYNMATRLLEHFGNFRGLTRDVTNQHIHTGPAGMQGGPVTVPLTRTGGAREGGLWGSMVLNAAQEADLLNGNMYTNVHSASPYQAGEIRAQLMPTTPGQTEYLTARLQGAQQTPPNGSLANGVVNALVDKGSHTLYLTSTFSGLTKPATNAHIHKGKPTMSGTVIVQLKFTTTTTGALDTAQALQQVDEDSILSGNTYVNIHTDSFPGGEIRGQLTNYNQLRYFADSLTGSQEVPPVTTGGRGTVIVRYNPETNLFELTGDYQNLSSNVVASHIHGPAPIGSVANPPLFDITNTGGTMGTLTVTRTLTETEEGQLFAGNWYANVHTANNGGGEIRAQLIPTTIGETQYLVCKLDAAQSNNTVKIPPNPAIVSSGTGTATVLLDRVLRNVFVTGNYSNLNTGITNTHIHRGAADTTGPVSVQLQRVNTTTTGTITGAVGNLRPALVDSIMLGLSYINIHTAAAGGGYPGGEIRGQLGNLVLPVKLVSFNAYRDRDKVAVVWTSAQEQNLASYDVEQQDAATKLWARKGTVIAKGSSTLTSYRFNDVPNIGKSPHAIYRLKMNDADGKYSYSQVVRINYQKGKGELMILSNPVTNGVLRFSITGLPLADKAEASVMDYNGRVVAKTSVSSLLNNQIDVRNLASGLYKLVVRVNDELMQQNFIK